MERLLIAAPSHRNAEVNASVGRAFRRNAEVNGSVGREGRAGVRPSNHQGVFTDRVKRRGLGRVG